MKKYNVENYVRYKEDINRSMPSDKPYNEYTRDELIIRFLPLVENIAKKFSTSQQASGVMDITDLIQEGAIALTQSVDNLKWETLNDSEDMEKTLKSFFSKRIKGSIRRAIDINRGDIRIPEHKLTEIRKNPDNTEMVAMFFNSVFDKYDDQLYDDYDDHQLFQIEDKSKDYNIDIMNRYILSLMAKHLKEGSKEYEVLRLSYGLDCDKHSAAEIAKKLNLTGPSSDVRISETKRQAIKILIENTKPNQVIDYI
jgi:RNA polymerase sigma factor (sigma-70 family)